MPLLAYMVDTRYSAHYGTVYATAQVAVCLAYFLGPLLGGQLIKLIGFPKLIRIVGLLNVIYCPLCIWLKDVCETDSTVLENCENSVSLKLLTFRGR